jgi:hypothetical protein
VSVNHAVSAVDVTAVAGVVAVSAASVVKTVSKLFKLSHQWPAKQPQQLRLQLRQFPQRKQ